MKITCEQFEGLLSFYLNNDLGENLTCMVEEHLRDCPRCKTKYDILHTIIDDIKGAYNKFINGDDYIIDKQESNTLSIKELSAYIDNELSDEQSIKIRRNIITKPKLREKIDKLYKLRKLLTESFNEHKGKLKKDYAKNIMQEVNTNHKTRQAYYHCIGFIVFVLGMVCLSILVIMRML